MQSFLKTIEVVGTVRYAELQKVVILVSKTPDIPGRTFGPFFEFFYISYHIWPKMIYSTAKFKTDINKQKTISLSGKRKPLCSGMSGQCLYGLKTVSVWCQNGFSAF